MIRGRPSAPSAGGPIHAAGRPREGCPWGCALCLLALVGCGGSADRTVENDPLLGPGGRALPPVTAASTTSGGEKSTLPPTPRSALTDRQLPELPAPNPKITAAGLAAGQEQMLDSAPRLQIAINPPTPKPVDPGPWRNEGSAVVTPIVPVSPVTPPIDAGPWRGQGVTLQGPTSAGDPRLTIVPVAAPAGQSKVETLQKGIDLLEGRGVTMHRLEKTEDGQYKFLCLLPDRQNPTTFHRYEARAAGDPVNAVRAVIEQIDRDGR